MAAQAEEDLNALAPVGPAAWLYLSEANAELNELLSVLSVCDRHCPVVIAPLLVDLTVDRDFSSCVRTPVSVYDGGVLTKVTSFCPFVLYFHNTDGITGLCEDHGDVARLCAETRRRFGMSGYSPPPPFPGQDGGGGGEGGGDDGDGKSGKDGQGGGGGGRRPDTDLAELCRSFGLDPASATAHLAFGNAMKEFLYAGCMVPCPEEAVRTQLGASVPCVKIPLYPSTVFAADDGAADDGADPVAAGASFAAAAAEPFPGRDSEFVRRRGFFSAAVSETLYYYLFTCWGQAIRFDDVDYLIEAGARQFAHDSQQTVKLAARKRYRGYTTQKLSSGERDQLLLSDAVCCELAFSYASMYLDSAYDLGPGSTFSEWPAVKASADHAALVAALTDLKLHLSSHVGALVFSSNSVLYQTRIVYVQPPAKAPPVGDKDGLMRAVQFCNGTTCLYDDLLNDARKTVKFAGPAVKDERYMPHHLAWACGTCPQLASSMVWYLNRVAVYNSGQNGSSALLSHLVGSVAAACDACGGRCCQSCYETAFVRVATRLPPLPRAPRKEPFVVTMLSRFLNDVDVLGSYGRRYNTDPKDGSGGGGDGKSGAGGDDGSGGGGGGGGGNSSVDRMKYLGQLLDYCKKNGLVNPDTGEDAASFRGKADFVATLTALNRHVDDLAASFVSEVRAKSSKDEVSGATQAFNVDMNPFALSFCPLLTFEYYRVLFAVLQSLAMVYATPYVVDNPLTGAPISRWLHQHFQSICGAFSGVSERKGFLFTRDVKCSKNVEHDRVPDFRLYAASGRYAVNTAEIKLCKLSVQAVRTFRVKNRPISRPSKNNTVSVYFKREAAPRRSPVKGCLAFLLFRHHDKVFPGCGLSCLEFWQKVCCNAVPRSVDIGAPEEFNAFVRFVLSVTADYGDHDLIDVQPDSILTYADYRFHNKFLFYMGFKDYISTMHGLTTRLTPQNHMQFPYLLGGPPRFGSVAEYALHCKRLKAEGVPAPRVATVARESMMRSVFEHRSLVTVSLGIEKYSSANSKDIFQFGQIGYFVGSGVERSLNGGGGGMGGGMGGGGGSAGGQEYRFMRQRFVIATKLADVVIRSARRETVLFDANLRKNRVMAALDAEGAEGDPELLALAEIMDGLEEGDVPDVNDILFFVDGAEHVAASIAAKLEALVESGVSDFSLENLQRFFGSDAGYPEGAAPPFGEDGGAASHGDGGTHDLSGLFLDERGRSSAGFVNLGDDSASSPSSSAGGGTPAKRLRL